jgi:hypothetical protein
MMMTVLRQRGHFSQLDHLVCIEQAADRTAVDMIQFARKHNKAVLAGLDSGEAIIKPLEAGDEALSFERLYDTCITIREFRRMQQAKVNAVEELPPGIFEMRIALDMSRNPQLLIRLVAKNDADVLRRLMTLANTDEKFREEFGRRLLVELLNTEDGSLIHGGALQVHEHAPEGTPLWEFVD